MAITNPDAADKLDAAIANGQTFPITKLPATGKGSGTLHSYWKVAGFPLAGTNPPVGAGAIPNRQTVGAIPLTAFGANSCYLAKVALGAASTAGSLFLGDRLWANSGLNGTLTTVQNINSPIINRNVGGSNLLFIEFYTATGASVTNLSINFTNTLGVAKTQSVAMPTSPVAGQMVWVPLADSIGVQSIQSVQLSSSTGTAGDFGLTIVKLIEVFPLANNATTRLGVYDMALPQIEAESCLYFYSQLTSTTVSQLLGTVNFAIG